jgi:hypothetical protein
MINESNNFDFGDDSSIDMKHLILTYTGLVKKKAA